ncbi:unnamed protein product [Urochloa humidicola]
MKKFSSYFSSLPAAMYLLTTIMLAIAISCCVVKGSCSEIRDGHPDGARERLSPPAPRSHGPLPSHRRLDGGGEGRRRPGPSPPSPNVNPSPHTLPGGNGRRPPPTPSFAP